jgi:hypothetical protein
VWVFIHFGSLDISLNIGCNFYFVLSLILFVLSSSLTPSTIKRVFPEHPRVIFNLLNMRNHIQSLVWLNLHRRCITGCISYIPFNNHPISSQNTWNSDCWSKRTKKKSVKHKSRDVHATSEESGGRNLSSSHGGLTVRPRGSCTNVFGSRCL